MRRRRQLCAGSPEDSRGPQRRFTQAAPRAPSPRFSSQPRWAVWKVSPACRGTGAGLRVPVHRGEESGGAGLGFVSVRWPMEQAVGRGDYRGAAAQAGRQAAKSGVLREGAVAMATGGCRASAEENGASMGDQG